MDNNIEKEAYLLMMRFENLSEEGQKAFLKELFVDNFFGSYIKNKVDNFKEPIGKNNYIPSKEEVDSYKEKIVGRVDNAVDSLLNNMYSNDEQFKSKIFGKFIKSYTDVAKETKEEICGSNHDFSKWVEGEGTIPVYNTDGEVDGYSQGKYYTRKCYYCGKIEKVYSQECIEQLDEKNPYFETLRSNNKKNGI